MKRALGLLALALASCVLPTGLERIPAPEEVRLAALGYARRYAELGAVYEWGGQDPLPSRLAVDCSGLVVRCYGYACADYGYRLPFADSTAAGMRAYSDAVEPEPGDLIFMGSGGLVSHVALFSNRSESAIFFIDSTTGDLVDGVSLRSYAPDDPRFIAFGRLELLRP